MTIDEVRKALAPHEGDLHAVVLRAFDRWQRRVARAFSAPTARMRANAIHDLMIEEAARVFDGHPHISVVVGGGRRLLRFALPSLPAPVLVQFKKLNEAGVPTNYPTQTALAFNMQLPVPEIPNDFRLTVGYKLDKIGAAVAQVCAVCMDGLRAAWAYDLAAAVTSVIPLASRTAKAPARRLKPKGGVVLPFRPKKSGGGGGDGENGGDDPTSM